MKIKTKAFRNFLFVLLLTFSFLLLSANTLGAFDRLSNVDGINNIIIGTWSREKSIVQLVKNEKDWIEDKNYDDDYLFDLIFESYDPNNLNDTVVNPLYDQYTIAEVAEVISLIKDFTDNFLTRDENGAPIYPTGVEVKFHDVELTEGLLPGESLQIHKVLNTADATSDHSNGWIPIMIAISIEKAGVNISDFAVEMLIDGNAFDTVNPISYRYVLWDANSGSSKNRLQSDRIHINSFNNRISNTISYITEAWRKNGNNYTPVFYQHQLNVPALSGDWNRLMGPNYYLGESSWNNHQTYYPYDKKYQAPNDDFRGMVLSGTASGKPTEIRLEIPNRNPQDTYIIPFVINVSRGIEIGIPLEEQTEKRELPSVKIKVVKGEFLWSD